jgi:hypothetical protein
VHAVDLEVALQVRAGHPERAGRGGDVRDAARGQQPDQERRVRVAGPTAVVGLEPHRRVGPEQLLEDLPERHRRRVLHRSGRPGPGLDGHRRITAFA